MTCGDGSRRRPVRRVGLRRIATAVGLLVAVTTVAAAHATPRAARFVTPHRATAHLADTGVLTVPRARVTCSRGGPRCRVRALLTARPASTARLRTFARRSLRLTPRHTSAVRFRLPAARAAAVRKAGNLAAILT